MIHSTSVISPEARVSARAEIGPFCVIGDGVVIEDGVKIQSHVSISGDVVIGEDTVVYPFVTIGSSPQDLKYRGEKTSVRIGKRNTIREQCTIHLGTAGGGSETIIGNDCLLMVGCHLAHDCIVGDGVIMANNSTLGGHVTIGNNAVLGGLSAVHQFVNVGAHAIIGGVTAVVRDVIPYGMVHGDRAKLRGLNLVGMRRHGISNADIKIGQRLFNFIFAQSDDMDFKRRLELASEKYSSNMIAKEIIDFLQERSKRSTCLVDGW